MARYEGVPPDYTPSLQLNLRQEDEGGDLLPRGTLIPDTGAETRRECLLLIHGYNNHRGEAAAAYLRFRNGQCAQYEDVQPERLNAWLADTFWPGDAAWPGLFDWLDFLYYPRAVAMARASAPMLADLLWRLPRLETIDVIAHSLGCRVTLETLRLLRQRGQPRIRRVCLMAAAVPCEMVAAGGEFETLLWEMHFAGTEIRVLHSRADLVLMLAFGPGQALAGEPTMGALGRHGPPPDMPGRGATLTEQRISGAGHGDYWGQKSDCERSAASALALQQTGEFFKIGMPRRRSICVRPLGEVRAAGCAREIGDAGERAVYA